MYLASGVLIYLIGAVLCYGFLKGTFLKLISNIGGRKWPCEVEWFCVFYALLSFVGLLNVFITAIVLKDRIGLAFRAPREMIRR